LERVWLSGISSIFVWIGSFWLAAMLYFFLSVVILDVIRLINHWFPFIPMITKDYVRAKQITMLVIMGFVSIILIAGYINALSPKIKTLNLTIPKTTNMAELNIVAASDVHLGTIVGKNRFCKIVKIINSLQPDIVLLVGDIVDEDLGPVIKQNLGEALKNINSKFGVFAVTGNHEYIGGVDASSQYLKEHNVVVLRDSAIKINNSVYIVGREDRSSMQFVGKKQKILASLMPQVNKNYPIILMDHQPFGLNEAVENNVDLQLSGHTHHGQLFPFNFLTKAIFEKSWGYLKKGNTHFYISSGVGTWGPPIRIRNTPEIVNIKLRFKTSDN